MKDNDTSISIDNELHSHAGPWVLGSDLDDELVLEDHQGNSHSIPMVLESDAKVRQLTNCEAFKHSRGGQVEFQIELCEVCYVRLCDRAER